MSRAVAPSTDKPVIAVCGATGFQGGSVVKHLLRDGRFAIRALTRKLNSAHAKEIASLGVSVVRADFDDLPSLCQAFQGCYGVFGITDYFEAFEKEAQQGYNIVDAAKAAKVKHLVFLSAPDVPYEVVAFKHKVAASAYLQESGIPFTLFSTSFYYSNIFLFDAFIPDRKTGGWRFEFPFPTDVPIPSVSPRDIGAFILGAFANPSEWVGKEMRVVSEYISLRQYGEILAEVTGLPVEIREVTQEQFLNLEHKTFRLRAWGIFRWFLEQHNGGKPYFSVDIARRLCPDGQTFREYAMEHMELPPEQPMMIQCVRTQERFSENSLAPEQHSFRSLQSSNIHPSLSSP